MVKCAHSQEHYRLYTMSSAPRLSLIIPTYNEARRVVATIDTARTYLASRRYRSEIIVVDDGSADDTAGVTSAAFPDVHVVRYEENRGKDRGG